MIMKYLTEELESIENDYLSTEERRKKNHLIQVASLAGHFPIDDAHNLKKVYDLYKHPHVDFNS